jgi:regulatory protein
LTAGDRSELERVYQRALAFLAARARSTSELRKKLTDKGEDPVIVDAVIARLVERRFIDDRAYAAAKARSAVARGRSTRRAALELAQKGVDRVTAAAAVAEALDERGEDELALCARAASKKLRSLSSAERGEQRRKLYAFLARQGFSSDAIRHAMRKVLDPSDPRIEDECDESELRSSDES